jgi:hypothetical protein
MRDGNAPAELVVPIILDDERHLGSNPICLCEFANDQWLQLQLDDTSMFTLLGRGWELRINHWAPTMR